MPEEQYSQKSKYNEVLKILKNGGHVPLQEMLEKEEINLVEKMILEYEPGSQPSNIWLRKLLENCIIMYGSPTLNVRCKDVSLNDLIVGVVMIIRLHHKEQLRLLDEIKELKKAIILDPQDIRHGILERLFKNRR